jgi:hypothetical protein
LDRQWIGTEIGAGAQVNKMPGTNGTWLRAVIVDFGCV